MCLLSQEIQSVQALRINKAYHIDLKHTTVMWFAVKIMPTADFSTSCTLKSIAQCISELKTNCHLYKSTIYTIMYVFSTW